LTGGVDAAEDGAPASPRGAGGAKSKAKRSKRQQLDDEVVKAKYLADLKQYVEERGDAPNSLPESSSDAAKSVSLALHAGMCLCPSRNSRLEIGSAAECDIIWQLCESTFVVLCPGLELGEGWTVSLVARSNGTQAGGTDKCAHASFCIHVCSMRARQACSQQHYVVNGQTEREQGTIVERHMSGPCRRVMPEQRVLVH
jgi:hypothetical protein